MEPQLGGIGPIDLKPLSSLVNCPFHSVIARRIYTKHNANTLPLSLRFGILPPSSNSSLSTSVWLLRRISTATSSAIGHPQLLVLCLKRITVLAGKGMYKSEFVYTALFTVARRVYTYLMSLQNCTHTERRKCTSCVIPRVNFVLTMRAAQSQMIMLLLPLPPYSSRCMQQQQFII